MIQQIIAPAEGWYCLRVAPQSLAYSKRERFRVDQHGRRHIVPTGTTYVFPAEEALEMRGMRPFVPTEGSWRRRSRYYREKDRQRVRKPLLTGYILIDPPEPVRWDLILNMPIVIGVITNHLGEPVRIPKSDERDEYRLNTGQQPRSLSAVMAQHRTNALAEQEHMPTGRVFAVGDDVELTTTGEPWSGFRLIVKEIGIETTKVLAMMFGRESEVEVATWKLASVKA